VIGETLVDRDHLAMRGRVPQPLPGIAPARQGLAILHDHRAKRHIGFGGERDRLAHQLYIASSRVAHTFRPSARDARTVRLTP